MADVKNKRVDIYIDQSSAINALDNLQKKADGFNKKIDDAREKQKQLLETIKQSQSAAANIDGLRSKYSDLSKEIDKNKKSLEANKEEYKDVQQQLKLLTEKLVDARDKEADLAEKIINSSEAGKSTVKLQQQFEAVTREIERTTDKINLQSTALAKLEQENIDAANAVARLKQEQAGVKGDIKVASTASTTIKESQKQYDSLNHTIDANTEAVNKNKEAQKEVQSQIDSGLRPSLDATKNQVTKLRNELIHMSEDAPGYAEKFKSFRSAEENLQRLNEKMQGVQKTQRSWLAEAKTVAFGVLIGNTVQSAAASISNYLSGLASGNGKLSDSLSNIEKSTGLSTERVKQLNSELGKLDTRTKAEDLREIAIGLGQIGEAANAENVAAIDKIVVALGDEFGGGAKEITNSLSILRNNLQDVKTANYGDDVAKIGNALNVLGAEGLATAPVVTDFANRMAGIAGTFKLSAGQILGVSASFQELGINVERGSTAFTKILQKIAADPKEFVKIAGGSLKEFTNLINNDMLGAFVKVAEGAKKAGTSNVVFAKILRDLDADGSGAGEVLSKVAKNSELLASKVKLASDALTNTNSITDEFNKKNTNLAANFEKLGKIIGKLFYNSTVVNVLGNIVTRLTDLLQPAKSANDQFNEMDRSVKNLESNILPLANRYDELKSKTTLNKNEQVELNKIVQTITATIPGAITQFDKYGNAIAISTGRVRQFISAEKDRLKVVNASAITEADKAIQNLKKDLESSSKRVSEIETVGFYRVRETSSDFDKGSVKISSRESNQKETAEAIQHHQDLLSKFNGYLQERKRLNGDALDEQIKAQADASKQTNDIATYTSQDGQKKNDQLLNEVKAFNKKLQDLKFQSEQASKNDDQKELDAIKEKYEKIFEEYGALAKKIKGTNIHLGFSTDDLTATENEELQAAIQKQKEKHDKEQAELFKKRSSDEYETQIANNNKYFEGLKTQEAQRFVDGIIGKKEYEANIAAIDVAAKKQNVQTAVDYSSSVEKAAADVTNFQKEELKKQTADLIAAYNEQEASLALMETLRKKGIESSLQTRVINTKQYGNGDEQAKAQKDLLAHQRNEKLAELEKEREDALKKITETGIDRLAAEALITTSIRQQQDQINAQFDSDEEAVDKAKLAKKIKDIEEIAQMSLSIAGTINDTLANKENANLNKEIKANDLKKVAFKKQLDSKVISQQQYNKQIAALDKDIDSKKEAIEKKQFERNQKLQIAQALMNGALAITNIWATTPKADFGAMTYIMLALNAVATVASVAKIASQKFADGGKVEPKEIKNGKIETSSNIPLQPNGDNVLATVKTGEVILNEKQQEDLGGAETFRKIGVPGFAGGGAVAKPFSVKRFWENRPYKSMGFSTISKSLQINKFAEGGLVAQQLLKTKPAEEPNKTPSISDEPKIIVQNTMSDRQEELMGAILSYLQNPVSPEISLAKIEKAQKTKQQFKKDTEFK